MDKSKILVVDDDPVVSLSCQRILGAEGFDTSISGRGQEALGLIGKENFGLLISDIRLPDMSGMSVLREAKNIQPDMEVIMMTGYPTLEDAKESIRLGAVDYVEKPFAPDFMAGIARKVFDRRGWAIKRALIEQFKEHIVPLEVNGITYHENGVWTKAAKDGSLEIGCDVRYLFLGGDLVYVEFIKGLEIVKAGEPFARLLTSKGDIVDLASPTTMYLKKVNMQANDVVVTLSNSCISEGWLLRLATAQTVTVD